MNLVEPVNSCDQNTASAETKEYWELWQKKNLSHENKKQSWAMKTKNILEPWKLKIVLSHEN